jgi:hypothetical protein
VHLKHLTPLALQSEEHHARVVPLVLLLSQRAKGFGVLHHLADPEAGWRVLLSLLAPGGIMRIGLYSEAARRSIVEARALIAERGYPATAEGIRALRQAIIREKGEPRWQLLVNTVDFYSMSGCRDIFFNVMEHRFTLPQIKAVLDEHGLSFLGFELDSELPKSFTLNIRARRRSQISITGTLSRRPIRRLSATCINSRCARMSARKRARLVWTFARWSIGDKPIRPFDPRSPRRSGLGVLRSARRKQSSWLQRENIALGLLRGVRAPPGCPVGA